MSIGLRPVPAATSCHLHPSSPVLIVLMIMLFAVAVLAGCSGSAGTLVVLPADIDSLLPDYDRAGVATRRAVIQAGAGDYATIGLADCDYATIGEALEQALSDIHKFYLMDPVYRVAGLRIERDVALIGFGARDTVLEAAARPEEASAGVLRIEAGVHVYLSGITVRAGKVTEVPRRGGGVSNSGFLVMEDCAVIENLATYGVGVWTEGRLEMRRCVIAGNVTLARPQPDEYKAVDCGGKGAGLRVEKGGFALVEDCLIAYNEAIDAGGALHISCESSARLVNTMLYGNTAVKRGGAIDLAGGQLEMERCTLAGNASNGKGQAFFHRGMLSMTGCLFADNGPGNAHYLAKDKMGEYGGGIFKVDQDNFDSSGSLPLAATGTPLYVRLHAGEIRSRYGAVTM